MFSDRIKKLKIFIIICTGIIIGKLFHIQIIETDYKIYAEKNAVRVVRKYSPRGIIYDRNNQILVTNIPSYNLNIDLQNIQAFDTLQLSQLLDVKVDKLKHNIAKAKKK